jgi:CheY-like chemotaxis protein
MAGGGVVHVSTHRFDVDDLIASKFVDVPRGPYVRIDVRDEGAGMSYEAQTHVFEPFFTTKASSTGLKLAAAYGLVKVNRGHIWFDSEPKKGSTFSICFPTLDLFPRATPSASAVLRGTETVLVVDDDAESRAQARDALLELGYRVIEANNGNEGVKLFEQERDAIDLVLTSVMMPKMTGFELAKRLSGAKPSICILFMSAYSEYALRRHGALPEGSRILQKPFISETMARAVRQMLDARSSAGPATDVPPARPSPRQGN